MNELNEDIKKLRDENHRLILDYPKARELEVEIYNKLEEYDKKLCNRIQYGFYNFCIKKLNGEKKQ